MSYREPPAARALRTARRILVFNAICAGVAIGAFAGRGPIIVDRIGVVAAAIATFLALVLLSHLLDRKDPR